MTDPAFNDILATLTTFSETGRDRPSRVTCARAVEALNAYRTAALHYMDGRSIVDSRAVGGTVTWGVGGRDVTDAEMAALTDLCAELGEPFYEDDDDAL